ncbi:hypothetical protein BDF19DRAFT_412037 [Syncephalis fuscata]|nr:hypothetical protein BDF19DRAFT_412037 [Syncephalis fuscata]
MHFTRTAFVSACYGLAIYASLIATSSASPASPLEKYIMKKQLAEKQLAETQFAPIDSPESSTIKVSLFDAISAALPLGFKFYWDKYKLSFPKEWKKDASGGWAYTYAVLSSKGSRLYYTGQKSAYVICTDNTELFSDFSKQLNDASEKKALRTLTIPGLAGFITEQQPSFKPTKQISCLPVYYQHALSKNKL